MIYPSESVLSVEKISNRLLPSLAYGFDEYGDHVMQALKYLSERFGSVSSFTGTYEADRFSLSIRGRTGLQNTSGNTHYCVFKSIVYYMYNYYKANVE